MLSSQAGVVEDRGAMLETLDGEEDANKMVMEAG